LIGNKLNMSAKSGNSTSMLDFGSEESGNAANKRQKVHVDKAIINTTAILMKQSMLNHESIAKAKQVYEADGGVGTDQCAEWYCEFMTLKIMNGDYDPEEAQLSPGGIVDEFWHDHILDTVGYAKFFKDVNPPSGEMVHHDALKSLDSDELIEERQEKTRSVSFHTVYFVLYNIYTNFIIISV